MSEFRDNLVKARSHILFIVGLLIVTAFVLATDKGERIEQGAAPAPKGEQI
jgi:hypothetical protein